MAEARKVLLGGKSEAKLIRLENEFAEFKGSFRKREGFQSMLRPGKYSF